MKLLGSHRNFIAVAVFAGLCSFGLVGASTDRQAPAPAGSGVTTYTIVVDGLTRVYLFHRGTTAPATDAPLVVSLHSSAVGGAAAWAKASRMNAAADANGYLVAYPDDAPSNWGGCCKSIDQRDIHFVSAMIDQLVAGNGADPHRVYVVGFSAGAVGAYYMACQLSAKIAAIAVQSGEFNGNGGCVLTHPMPLLHIHGTGDKNIPYNGIGTVGGLKYWPSIPLTVATWAANDACPNPPTVTWNPTSTAYTTDYACDGGVDVQLVTVLYATHTLYRGEPTHGYVNSVDAWWAFVSQFRLPDVLAG